jgi:hypothetical protein
MRVRVLGEAKQDLVDGYRFYESQEEGLGEYFLESLLSDIDSLHKYAGIHPQHFGRHRLLSKRFPYAVYYQVEDGAACVRAVLDCRQDPSRTERRLLR